MITRRNMLMGAMAGLVGCVVGCGQPSERPVDTNPNPMFGCVNLSTSKTGYTFGLVVDEDRDGTPDYVTYEPVRGGNRILYLRPGFEPKHPSFIVDQNTREMDAHMQAYARQAMRNGDALNYIVHNPTKKNQ